MRLLKPYKYQQKDVMFSLTRKKWVWIQKLDMLLWPLWKISENGPLVTSSLWLGKENTGTVPFKMWFQGSKENFTGLGIWCSCSEFETRPWACPLCQPHCHSWSLTGSSSLLSPSLQEATITIILRLMQDTTSQCRWQQHESAVTPLITLPPSLYDHQTTGGPGNVSSAVTPCLDVSPHHLVA